MKEHLSSDDIFAEIQLLSDVFDGCFLILEGTHDCLVLDMFVDAAHCRTIPAHSKLNALDVVKLAEKTRFEGVLGIVDADFDRLQNRVSSSLNVCTTDYHDLDIMIIASSAGEAVVSQHCDQELYEVCIQRLSVSTFIDAAIDCACGVGLLRWVSERGGLNLNFQVLNFSVFLDHTKLEVISSELIRAVIGDTRNCQATPSALAGEMAKLAAARPNKRHLANGHDVAEILAIALRHIIGKCTPEIASPKNIEKACRKKYTVGDFMATGMYSWIKGWEKRNATYTVLRI